ncbi:MAG: nucleoside hydrolase [Clostridia bacterium]|nr:nucleoside hydrolase [Clostridia bacterium]
MKMSIEEILEDIRSDRVKKVIYDADSGCDIDDQYAIAHAFVSPRMELLSVNSTPYIVEGQTIDEALENSYNENNKVLKALHCTVPNCIGCTETVSGQPDFGPVDCPAVRNIVDTAMASDEIIYVLSTGALTHAASAILMEPAIKDKICVIWVGCTGKESGVTDEFNLNNDYRAGQIVLNSGVPFVFLPSFCSYGTINLKAVKADLDKLTGTSDAAVFFREYLPGRFDIINEEWSSIFWDVASTGVLAVPEGFKLSIIPAPVFTDDKRYVFDSTRHKIIYMEGIDKDIVLGDVFRCIQSLG